MKILLPLLLLATLGMLVALPHMATASNSDQAQQHGDHHQTDRQTGQDRQNEFGHGTLAVFHVRLTGDAQVPPVNTDGLGFAEVRLFQNGTSSAIEFRVVVCNIANVTRSHIHVGNATSNGAIVVHFIDLTTPVSSTHGCTVLSSGIRGPNDLHPAPSSGVNTWTDFVHALLSGNTYVNVHTTANPGGEIRGQLV
ncbi:MAG TPA: CHRD domain-containing protein [Candidatus Dormibacteraeota bacterium]|nr:CHRD domain-containing protein [Candidatus Dormibacteraeota bacterium]